MPRSAAVVSLFVVAVVTLARPAWGQAPQIQVRIDPTMGQPFADQIQSSLPALQTQLEGEIANLFQTYRLKDYVRSFGDAQAFTSRGLGVDYGSNIRYFEVGVAGSVAINGSKAAFEGNSDVPPVAGLASNFTVMAGASLGALGIPVNVFANYFNAKGSYQEYDAKVTNVGVHFQLKLLSDRDSSLLSALFRWGGIDLTTGFDRAHMILTLARGLVRDFPITGSQPAAVVGTSSTGVLSLDTRVFSIPLEVSTNVRFLYLLSAYVGAGLDLQVSGDSQLTANLDGTMTGKVPSLGFSQGIGSYHVTAVQKSSLTAAQVRGMLGVQVNLFAVKLFAQLNLSPSPLVGSAAFGARIAY